MIFRPRSYTSRHVDAVDAIVAAIGEAAAEFRARLEDEDRRPGAHDMKRDRRAAEAAADDGDGRAVGV